MSTDSLALTWSAPQLARAIEALARASGLDARPTQIPYDSGNASLPKDVLDKWIQDNAQWFGLEAEYVDVTYDAVDEMLRRIGPALLQLRGDGEPEFLVLLEGGKSVSVLAPDLSTRKVSSSWVRSWLAGALGGAPPPSGAT